MNAAASSKDRAWRPLAWGSVRWRLLTLLSAVIASISLFIFLFFPGTIERQALNGIRDKAEGIAAMAAYSLSPAVAFEDFAGMEETLAAVLENQEVRYVEIRRVDGAVLAARSPASRVGPAGDSENVLAHSAPVIQSGSTIAFVVLEMSLSGLQRDVAGARKIIALVSFLVFMLGILAAMLIASHVTAPLRLVAATADRIASGDLDSRADYTSRDEVGQLARNFNRMLDRLQSAHEQVEIARTRLEEVLDNVPAEVAMLDPDGRFVYVNPAIAKDAAERSWVMGKRTSEFADHAGLDAEEGRQAEEAANQCIRERTMVRVETSSGEDGENERHFIRQYSPILDRAGQLLGVVAHGLDITELRHAEAELQDTRDRLMQSQKMETVGRLAGGIAHDFNNLLTTMSGNAELVLLEPEIVGTNRELVGDIMSAAARAAALTQQLLAFSRKQVTQPKVLNLNATIEGFEKMLHRLIGEDVRLVTELREPLHRVMADPGQIEQVIMNLAVNSRDAMPLGGSLELRTENVTLADGYRGGYDETMPPGRYVQVTVADTGTGMDPATLDRIFEPFFTNKDIGKGTGLGLATVYGIVKQSKGFIRAYSEVGMGTTFKVFLPAVEAEVLADDGEASGVRLIPGHETILLAEDQQGVRALTRRVLERCGYSVLPAEGGREALALATTYPGHIDLLLTDVVMPDMSGPELVAHLSASHPDTRVVYMSGYTDDQLQHHGVLDAGVTLVQKPFTAAGLSATLRSMLDRRTATYITTPTHNGESP